MALWVYGTLSVWHSVWHSGWQSLIFCSWLFEVCIERDLFIKPAQANIFGVEKNYHGSEDEAGDTLQAHML